MGGRRIDAPHPRMGEARAYERGVQHARQSDIVDEFALARKKPRILRAQHARADGFPAHRPAPMPACSALHLRATGIRCTSFDKLRGQNRQTLMAAQKGDWSPRTLLRLTAGIAVAALVFPFVVLIQFPLWLFGLQSAKRTPHEVAAYLKDFMDGTGNDYDWDDFEAVPIKDPRLDEIRKEAMSVKLPIDASGHEKLAELLARTEDLAAHNG